MKLTPLSAMTHHPQQVPDTRDHAADLLRFARKYRRKIIKHVGETNKSTTYSFYLLDHHRISTIVTTFKPGAKS